MCCVRRSQAQLHVSRTRTRLPGSRKTRSGRRDWYADVSPASPLSRLRATRRLCVLGLRWSLHSSSLSRRMCSPRHGMLSRWACPSSVRSPGPPLYVWHAPTVCNMRHSHRGMRRGELLAPNVAAHRRAPSSLAPQLQGVHSSLCPRAAPRRVSPSSPAGSRLTCAPGRPAACVAGPPHGWAGPADPAASGTAAWPCQPGHGAPTGRQGSGSDSEWRCGRAPDICLAPLLARAQHRSRGRAPHGPRIAHASAPGGIRVHVALPRDRVLISPPRGAPGVGRWRAPRWPQTAAHTSPSRGRPATGARQPRLPGCTAAR